MEKMFVYPTIPRLATHQRMRAHLTDIYRLTITKLWNPVAVSLKGPSVHTKDQFCYILITNLQLIPVQKKASSPAVAADSVKKQVIIRPSVT